MQFKGEWYINFPGLVIVRKQAIIITKYNKNKILL